MSSVSCPLIGPESSIQASDWSSHLPPGPGVSVSPPSPLRGPSEVTITSEMRQITWKLPTLGTLKYAHHEEKVFAVSGW